MIEIIGTIAVFLILAWLTAFAYFLTVPTLSPSIFSEGLLQKIIGVFIWVAILMAWIAFLI